MPFRESFAVWTPVRNGHLRYPQGAKRLLIWGRDFTGTVLARRSLTIQLIAIQAPGTVSKQAIPFGTM